MESLEYSVVCIQHKCTGFGSQLRVVDKKETSLSKVWEVVVNSSLHCTCDEIQALYKLKAEYKTVSSNWWGVVLGINVRLGQSSN